MVGSEPINNEWYNLSKGNGDRNLKRQHIELSASSYEYCYDNPVRFTDTSGEQVPPEETKQARSGVIVTEENDVRIPSSAQPPYQPVPDSTDNIQSGDDLLNEAFTAFQKEYYNENYEGAIRVIVEKYKLEEISILMSAKYSKQIGKSERLITQGQENIGYPQFTSVTYGDLKHAVEDITKFSELVLAVTHEYIHGFQRATLGMKEPEIREFYANQHSLFPNNSIIAREETLTFNVQFPEKTSDAQTFIWAGNTVKYYQALPKELQEKYHADMGQVIRVGLEAYEKIKGSILPKYQKSIQDKYNIISQFR